MAKITLSELHHNFFWMKCGWKTWMFLYFMVSGTCSLVTVNQPPVLSTALGRDVVMPCQLHVSSDEKMLTPPVLYWLRLTEDNENPRLWHPSEEYERRVNLLDKNLNTSNKSILLHNVQWEDYGKYLCKLSITTERSKSFRRKGNETLLMVYDTMSFNPISHNDSLLRCEVNVSREPGLVLSVFRDGCKSKRVRSAPGDASAVDRPYVTLSETVPLRGGGKYECQLQLNKDLITESIFHHPALVAGECGDDFTACLTTVPDLDKVVFAEPWLLYAALLLVPITVLLGLVISMLTSRC